MKEDFDADLFLKELEDSQGDLKDYVKIKGEILDLLQKMILDKEIQNKAYVLAIGTLVTAKSLIDYIFTEEDAAKAYKTILFKS